MFSITKATLFFVGIFSVYAQNCANSVGCTSQYQSSIQAQCGSNVNPSCICPLYQTMLSSCFSGCSDQASLTSMQQIQSQISSTCGGGNFGATPVSPFGGVGGVGGFGVSSTLIVNAGPTGLAVPMGSMGAFGQQNTISLASTPIPISKSTIAIPSFLHALFISFLFYYIY